MANCCVNVVITIDSTEYVLSTTALYEGDVFFGYQVGQDEFLFQLQLVNPEDGTWHFNNSSGSTTYFEATNLSAECPVSGIEEWVTSFSSEIESMYIIQIPCDIELESPNTIPELLPSDFISCKYQNFLKKQKAILANEVAEMKTSEVFGLKSCDKEWEKIYEKYLIIKGLECCPYDEYSLADEKCLIGHLTDNCNC